VRQRQQIRSPVKGSAAASIDRLIENNRRYAASFRKGDLPPGPSGRVAIVTCMDARLDPTRFLGLKEGEAHVVRNAGGSAREALRSLVISQLLLGTREVAVVKHTDCGMLGITNREIDEKIGRELGVDAGGIDFLPFRGLEEAVRDDVRFLHSSALIGDGVAIRGFIYDVKSGRVSELA
jgi:carbonic anhydrase